MANVIITYRVFPKEMEKALELKERIEQEIKPERISLEPLAFGIKVVVFSKLIEDKEGETERLEERLRGIEGISEFEVIEVSRSL